MRKFEQQRLFGIFTDDCSSRREDADCVSLEVRRVIDLMRECERTLSFFVVGSGLSPGEREALLRAGSALWRKLDVLRGKGCSWFAEEENSRPY
jgi:hypothetical protein